MEENKSNKTKTLSITMILLAIVIGFGFVIGFAQVTGGSYKPSVEDSELANFFFDEDGTWIEYTGNERDIVVPETYSLTPEPVEMVIYDNYASNLTSIASKLGVKKYTIEDLSSYVDDESGYPIYNKKFSMTFMRRKVIEGTDYTVKAVGEEIFSNDNSITSVKLPDTIEKLDSRCFAGAQSLKTINMPKSLKTIENAVFYLCPSLEEIIIPDGVDYISIQAFENCYNLKKVVLPKSLTYVYHWIVANTSISEITIPNKVSYISEGAFCNNEKLEHVYFDEGSVVYGLGEKAFANCPLLQEISLPSSLTSIYSNVFSGCTGLKEITLNSEKVPTLRYADLPDNVEKIYVKDDLYDEYLQSNNWSQYADKICKLSERV